MTIAAMLGYGTKISYSSDGVTYTALASVTKIKPPEIKADDEDITHLQSANQFKEFMAGLGDGGDASFALIFDATQSGTVYGLFRTTKYWQVEFNDKIVTHGTQWTCQGYINGYGTAEVEAGKAVKDDIKIKFTGKPTLTAAT